MAYDYLIEIRPLVEKLKLKRKIIDLKKELRLKNTHRVPHLTLIYDFKPKIQNYKIAELIKETASKYEDLCFEYSGWDLLERERGYVFGFKIKPSNQLKEFRYELYHNIKNSIIEDPRIKKFNTLSKDDFWFHSAISFHIDKTTAKRIGDFIKTEETPLSKLVNFLKNKDNTRTKSVRKSLLLPGEVTRIPVLRSGKITYEYDKFTNRILNRSEALSKKYKGSTLAAYRKKKKIELFTKNNDSKNQTWFISDTHFDHSNIIGYCARPFADVNEMNNILVDNWNNTVNKQDKVYFLGDIVYGRDSRPEDYWLNKLNGEIVYIRGNHYDNDSKNTKLYEKLDYRDHKFLLLHDPNESPIEWNDWTIHGHYHNNDLEEHPLINWEQKTVNVCVELTKYRPINFDKIIEFIENKKEDNVLTLEQG